jgi:hypothetical protein
MYQTGESASFQVQIAWTVSGGTTDTQGSRYVYQWLMKCFKVFLELHANYFSGSIPDWIGSLNLLNHLNLERNLLSGELPIGLCDLVNLQNLEIYDNSIEGMLIF